MDFILHLKDKSFSIIDVSKLHHQLPCISEFDWQDEHPLEKFLTTIPDTASISIIVDFIDENIHFEWVPKLLPWEKSTIEKRLTQKAKAEGAVFVHSNWMPMYQTNSEGRQEQQFQISSVLASENLTWLLSSLEEAQVSIKSMYSYAFLLEAFFMTKVAPALSLNKKKLKRPFIMVFREDQHHFRQIFFHNGRLRISRHIVLDDEIDSEAALNHALVHETRVAIKYLYNQKILPFNSEVGFIYINALHDNEEELAELYRQQIAQSSWDFDQTFIMSASLNQNQSEVCRSDFASICTLAEFIYKRKLASYYVNPYVEKIRFLTQLKHIFFTLSFVLSMSLLYFAVSEGINQYLLWSKLGLIEAKTQSYLAEKQRLQSSTELSYDAEDIKATVTFSEQLLQAKVEGDMGFDVKALAKILARHSHILMDQLEWSNNQKFDDKQVNLQLHGWVFPFKNSYQKPVEWVDALVKDFKTSNFASDVVLLEEPLNRSLKKSLSIVELEIEGVNALPFLLRIETKEKPQNLSGSPK